MVSRKQKKYLEHFLFRTLYNRERLICCQAYTPHFQRIHNERLFFPDKVFMKSPRVRKKPSNEGFFGFSTRLLTRSWRNRSSLSIRCYWLRSNDWLCFRCLWCWLVDISCSTLDIVNQSLNLFTSLLHITLTF